MSREESRMKSLPSSSVPSMKACRQKTPCSADCDVRQEKQNDSRAVGAAELEEANAADAIGYLPGEACQQTSEWACHFCPLQRGSSRD
eukprot:3152730-Pleurochrysis_carterae.AAC.1